MPLQPGGGYCKWLAEIFEPQSEYTGQDEDEINRLWDRADELTNYVLDSQPSGPAGAAVMLRLHLRKPVSSAISTLMASAGDQEASTDWQPLTSESFLSSAELFAPGGGISVRSDVETASQRLGSS